MYYGDALGIEDIPEWMFWPSEKLEVGYFQDTIDHKWAVEDFAE